jgi:1-acyl-sn-glycerol-3-phosphate acyltransferase
VAQTVADVDALAQPAEGNGSAAAAPAAAPASATAPAAASIAVPAHEHTWPLRPSLRHFRTAGFYSLVFPFLRTAVTRVTVEGAEQFAHLDRPMFFIANHQSMLDVPLILRALPRAWRPWLAPAMGIDPFVGAFNPHASTWRRFRDRWRLRLTQLFFNTYLLTPQGAVGASLRHTGRLADQGFCPLIFPEGRRTPDGQMHPFRPGIGVFAAALRLPMMPIYLEGLYEILPDGARRAKPGPARVRFGPVMRFPHESAEEIVTQLQSWYKMTK